MKTERDTYSLTLGELLHEVCRELLDGREMIKDLSMQRREHAAASGELPEVYDFALQQVRLRMDRYRQMGDLLDELITLYHELRADTAVEDAERYFTDQDDAGERECAAEPDGVDIDADEEDEYEPDDEEDEEDQYREWKLKKKKKKKDKKEEKRRRKKNKKEK